MRFRIASTRQLISIGSTFYEPESTSSRRLDSSGGSLGTRARCVDLALMRAITWRGTPAPRRSTYGVGQRRGWLDEAATHDVARPRTWPRCVAGGTRKRRRVPVSPSSRQRYRRRARQRQGRAYRPPFLDVASSVVRFGALHVNARVGAPDFPIGSRGAPPRAGSPLVPGHASGYACAQAPRALWPELKFLVSGTRTIVKRG